ncbi:hypothetical protein [Leisingera aquaemixtae]|jgi:hypothetical protein|uniref:hypothetical protein n=1 Tax=Leisingera aquaemixtae TaxID=1396826 RepID=UPI0011549270|nr:hypothetical protein [Leisingera aquaemixtae]QDI74975.1 hypothetical protein R2C4_04095 [Leisingera aquaemixtae]
MLKLKADAQPAVEFGTPRKMAVRIDGISAPKNMKVGLVAGGAGPTASSVMDPVKTSEPVVTSAAKAAQIPAPAAQQAPARTLIVLKAAKAVKAAFAARAARAELQPFAAAETGSPLPNAETGSPLPKLGLAAAGLAVASAMLLYFQFGGGTTPADIDQASLAPDAVLPAGAASAAGLAEGAGSGEDALVARITAGTLAALRSKQAEPGPATPAAAAAAPAEGTALFKMVMTAAAQGQSEAYIDQMVNGAYARREITVPASLIDAGGRVDTATLLALFVGN